MTNKSTPFLTGGILFSLLLETRKTRIKARARIKGESDGLSDPDVMAGLIYVITGINSNYQGDTLGKSTTQYKTCQISSNTYIPFTDISIISAYESAIKCHSTSLYNRATAFMEKFLSPNKHEWLIRALIETICNDTEIPDTACFLINSTTYVEKKNLSTIHTIEFQSFLLSVILFILQNRKDNTLGAETFQKWFSRSSAKSQWKFSYGTIGQSITANIQVRYFVMSEDKPMEYTNEIPSNMAPIIMGADGVAPDLSNLLNGDIYLVERALIEDETDDDEFQIYMKKATDYHSQIKTLLYSEKPRLFKDFYVCNDLCTRSYRVGRKQEMSNATIAELTKISKRFIISGTGGIGKSMMMKHLFFDAVKNYKEYQLVPILVSLKDYSADDISLVDFAYRSVQEYDPTIEIDSLITKIAQSKCILLLDGYDELTSASHKTFYNALVNFIKIYPNTNVVISSRPTNEFVQFGHFPLIDILPFKKEKALELIDKLDYHDPIAKAKFRHDLDTKLFTSHQQFASNPLLLTIMLMTYSSYGEVPAKRHIFYAKAYETMARLHDASKGAYVRPMHTKLSPEDFALYLSEFCARTYREETIEFTEQTFTTYMNKSIKRQGREIEATAHDFLRDLVDNLCIMYKEGEKYYFIHRSFQEYFCAVFFSKQMDDKLWKIGEFFENKKQRQYSDRTFDMLYDMIPEPIDKYIFLPFLQNLWAKCDSEEGYWTFLEEMYPVIYSQEGQPGELCENDPQSYLYNFIVNETLSRHNGELYNVSWPDSIQFCPTEEWVTVPDRMLAGYERVITRYETMTMEEWERRERNIFEEDEDPPEVEGITISIDILDIRKDTATFADLIDFIDNEEFPLKQEYLSMRKYTDYLFNKTNKKPSYDDWFDDF